MAFAWLDGAIVPAAEARLPLVDRGFLYGEGVFETVRIHRGAPFRLEAHMKRLREGLWLLDLEPPKAVEGVVEGARKLLGAQPMEEGLLRITVTPPGEEGSHPGTVAITLRPLPTVPPEIRLIVAETVWRVPGILSRCKSTSRVVERMAARGAQRKGAFDAILLNSSGNVVETTARNLFIASRRTLRTPPSSEGALEGVTRATVLELAGALGMAAEERPISVEELLKADEVFLSGSGVGVLPVARVQHRRYDPVPGELSSRLVKAYAEALDQDSRW
jgi:branched-chain amino acid aminotransferase